MQVSIHAKTHPEQDEPNIMEEEVGMTVRSSPKHKAAGVDGITTEAIKSCGETGIKVANPYIPKGMEERHGRKDMSRRLLESNCSPHLEKREAKMTVPHTQHITS